MAKSLYLQDALGGTTVSLQDTDIRLSESGFSYKTRDGLDWTTFEVVSRQSDALFRGSIATLDKLRYYAQLYGSDSTRSNTVYLYWASEGETLRRAVVYDIAYEIAANPVLNALLGRSAARLALAVQHDPNWEVATPVSISQGNLSTLGGIWVPAATESSVTARIKKLIVDGEDDEFANVITKVWVGIRDYRNGTSGFLAKWEAESGTNATDASDVSDAAASGGYKVQVTFATQIAMVKRFSVQWGQVGSANWDDITGRYLVLARLKLDAATTEVAIELRHGWLGVAGLESSLGVTYVSAVSDANLVNYNLVSLGMVDVPPTGDREAAASGTDIFIKSYGLALYAQRLSGSGSLDVDCFVLVPADHLMVVSQAAVNHFSGKTLRAYTGDDGEAYAVNTMLTSLGYGNVEFSFESWGLPLPQGVVVVAAQATGVHQLGGELTLSIDYVPRYRSYRYTT